MRKIKKVLYTTMVLGATFLMVMATDAQAAPAKSTSKVVYQFKDGTLTIKGKGKMPKGMTFGDNKKIKNVVIRKGVTSISNNAFSGCKNLKNAKIPNTVKEIGENSFESTGLKKIVIPKSVKKIGVGAFHDCDKLTTVTMPGDFKLTGEINEERDPEIMCGENITTINFSTNLKLNTVLYCEGTIWNVSEKDPNYKTIEGAIYSKDGKTLVRVPSGLKEFTIADGCETFSLQSIFYGQDIPDDGVYSCCSVLEKITISESVKYIEDEKYKGIYSSNWLESLKEIVVNSKQLDADSVSKLLANLREMRGYEEGEYDFKIDDAVKMFGDRVTVEGDFCILDKNVLIGYMGKGGTVTVPNGIKIIADIVFAEENSLERANIQKVILPESVEKIGEKAFYECRQLEEINMPNSLTEIGSQAFRNTGIKKIEIPESVNKLGEYAFAGTNLREAILPDEMSVIPKGLFSYSSLAKVNVPRELKKIEKEAFMGTSVDVQKFLNNPRLTSIGENAFTGTEWTKLIIPAHIKKIEQMAFDDWENKKRVITIQGSAKGYKQNAFSGDFTEKLNATLKFESGIKQAFTDIYLDHVSYKNNKTKVSFDWFKVQGADGYDIRISSSKNFKKDLKKITVKKKTRKVITIDKKLMKAYVKIRPYKVVKGKKVYGRWSSDMWSMYD